MKGMHSTKVTPKESKRTVIKLAIETDFTTQPASKQIVYLSPFTERVPGKRPAEILQLKPPLRVGRLRINQKR